MVHTMENQQGSTATEGTDTNDTSISADLIRKIIDERIRNESASGTLIHQQVLDCLRILPSKSYGDTSLSDNSNAILGDVYQFYNSNSNNEQNNILQNLEKRVAELCQRQDDRDARDAQITHLSELLKKSKEATSFHGDQNSIDVSALVANIKLERHPKNVLEECETIAIARRFLPDQCIDTLSYLPDLEEWICSYTSGLLLVQAESMAGDAAKDSAVAITRHLINASLPVAWYFSDPQAERHSADFAMILETLIVQLLETSSESHPSDLRGRGTNQPRQSDLIDFFRFLLTKLPRCFLIVEAPLYDRINTNSEECVQQLANLFTDVVHKAHLEGRALKILMVHQNTLTTVTPATGDFNPVRTTYILATPMPLAGARLQAIRMQNDLMSILDRAVLVTNEQGS